jgi:hypothetical protein
MFNKLDKFKNSGEAKRKKRSRSATAYIFSGMRRKKAGSV